MSSEPAGWYPDPDTEGYVRWWDGQGWADMHVPEALAPKPPSKVGTAAQLGTEVSKIMILLLVLGVFLVLIYITVGAFFA